MHYIPSSLACKKILSNYIRQRYSLKQRWGLTKSFYDVHIAFILKITDVKHTAKFMLIQTKAQWYISLSHIHYIKVPLKHIRYENENYDHNDET